jgi:Transposase DDE domain
MPVRELRFRVDQPGFRVNEIVLVTTLLDAELDTKVERADLFLKRWDVEWDLRSIKDVMQMDVLRGHSPEIVEKEIWMHLLVYNLIRGVVVEAARAHGKKPRQVSFKGALPTMTAFQDVLRRATPEERQRRFAVMLKAIAGHRVGNRPGRAEPRANKRRPKPQRYLTEPRKVARNRLLANAL